jgi:hypothetical protein
MVRGALAIFHPVVDMQVFNLCTRLEFWANESMVELLGVHVENVCVAFFWRNPGSFIDIFQVSKERVKNG